MRWLAGLALLLLVGAGIALWLAPEEPTSLEASFDPARLEGGVDEYLAAQEARVPGIVEGTQKRVIWAGASRETTDWAVVYVHGFSASSEETRPMPDLVAEALGANLFFTRLAGHGRDGAAMDDATLTDWMADMAEAMAVGRAIGERVLVIGTSTGATLATLAAADPALAEGLAGIAMISPNFQVKNPASVILTWPGARSWAPVLAGEERAFLPANEAQARYWTTRYPTTALLPMAETVKAARGLDHGALDVPAFFILSDLDQVVDQSISREVEANWGGPTQMWVVPEGVTEAMNHVLAGDILSPEMTGPVAERIADWARSLPGLSPD
ncbi:carboxylesterase [Roseivivax sp. THAF30]|uniref:alpha/beta hydrolase n=1 Tax=Roseivivax sp. THAF30 TaxID=2587852 RepID=UPI0012689756|nr:alpha/beta hydrolase [Roseivivax sp. THAF30]QFT62413.1 Thermostable monoacylglycerol lipase [Roseivivax sp. THAF30]